MTYPRPDAITIEVGPSSPAATAAYREGARPCRPLRITRRWRGADSWLLLISALFWNGFSALFVLYGVLGHDWLAVLCSSPFALVGVWFAYAVPAYFVNRTTITIDGSTLSIAHAPLPWPGGRVVELARLGRVFVRELDREGGMLHWVAAEVDGIERKLIGSIPPEQAHYLAQVLSARLDGSADRPV